MPMYLKIKCLLKQISLTLMSLILFFGNPSVIAFANPYPNNTNNQPVAVGIDVSKWNKGKIDWNAVKNAGFSFAIIKISKKDPDSQIAELVDERFEEFYEGAGAAGIKRGVYVFSYATNEDDAAREAEACLETLNGRALELPIAYDIEHNKNIKKLIKKGKTTTAEAINTFCDIIEDGGYQSMVYTGGNFIKKYINYDMISDKRLWLARYPKPNKNPTYQDYMDFKASEFPYYMWQFSSIAYVPTASYTTSVKNGKKIHHCDVNFIYDPNFADDGIEKLRYKTLQGKNSKNDPKDQTEEDSEEDLEENLETENTTPPSSNTVMPTALFFDKTYIDLDAKDTPTYQLKLSIFPAEASLKTVKFISSDTEIATVDNNGILTPKKSGTVVITASSGAVNTSTVINIKKDVVKPTSIQLNEYEVVMNPNDSLQLKSTIKPKNVVESVQYSSSDSSVASVDNKGKVIALTEGETVITVTVGTLSAECDIIVEKKDVEEPPKKTDKKQKDKKDKSDTKKNKDIEDIEDKDNKTKSKDKKKEINTSSSKINIIKSSVKMGVNEVFEFKLKLDKSIKKDDIVWQSSDTKIVSGYNNGIMTAKSKGTVILTAKLKSDPTIKDTVKVTVLEAPKSISLNKKSINLKKNSTYRLKPNFNKGAAAAKVSYKSSNSKIVKVSGNGNLRGIKKGSATITITTYNKKNVTIKVTVK